MGGALAGPVTAYVYDWNLLPMGQALWLKELETYIDFPAAAKSGQLQSRSGHAAGPANENDKSSRRIGVKRAGAPRENSETSLMNFSRGAGDFRTALECAERLVGAKPSDSDAIARIEATHTPSDEAYRGATEISAAVTSEANGDEVWRSACGRQSGHRVKGSHGRL